MVINCIITYLVEMYDQKPTILELIAKYKVLLLQTWNIENTKTNKRKEIGNTEEENGKRRRIASNMENGAIFLGNIEEVEISEIGKLVNSHKRHNQDIQNENPNKRQKIIMEDNEGMEEDTEDLLRDVYSEDTPTPQPTYQGTGFHYCPRGT